MNPAPAVDGDITQLLHRRRTRAWVEWANCLRGITGQFSARRDHVGRPAPAREERSATTGGGAGETGKGRERILRPVLLPRRPRPRSEERRVGEEGVYP